MTIFFSGNVVKQVSFIQLAGHYRSNLVVSVAFYFNRILAYNRMQKCIEKISTKIGKNWEGFNSIVREK